MQLFLLDTNPQLSAKYLCDKHINKQLIETAQILSNALFLSNVNLYMRNTESLYSITHKNNPLFDWCAHSEENFNWVCELGISICSQYSKRYNKTHASERIIRNVCKLKKNISKDDFPNTGLTSFMPVVNKNLESLVWFLHKPKKLLNPLALHKTTNEDGIVIFVDTVATYRKYYIIEKSSFAKWKYSDKPSWFKSSVN